MECWEGTAAILVVGATVLELPGVCLVLVLVLASATAAEPEGLMLEPAASPNDVATLDASVLASVPAALVGPVLELVEGALEPAMSMRSTGGRR